MTVVAVAMVKDEADIVAATVGHMLTQVDHVIVADNRSTDGTREILEQLPVELLDDPELGYYQSRKMSALAARAREHGARWVVPFDADEWWYSPFGRIADVLTGLEGEAGIAAAALYDHVPTGADPDIDDPTVRMTWRRRDPLPLPKVACRSAADLVIHQGNHGASYDRPAAVVTGQLVVRHLPYRSARQFVTKARNGAAAYAATDLPEDHGRHWRDYGRLLEAHGEGALEDVFRRWFWVEGPHRDATLIRDPVPR